MKLITLLLMCLMSPLAAHGQVAAQTSTPAQTPQSGDAPRYARVNPIFSPFVPYPEEAFKKGIKGTVLVTIDVDSKGLVTNVVPLVVLRSYSRPRSTGAESEEDFQQLDVAMKERRFFPQIRDDDGEAYWLPTGSYAIQNTDMVLKAAHDAAVGAAGESGFEFSIIVTGFDECEWTSLAPVEAPPSPA